MRSTPNLACGLPIRKGKTLLILGTVGHYQSWLLKIEIPFPQHNSRKYYSINSKIDIRPVHKEKKNPIDFGSGR